MLYSFVKRANECVKNEWKKKRNETNHLIEWRDSFYVRSRELNDSLIFDWINSHKPESFSEWIHINRVGVKRFSHVNFESFKHKM